MATERNGELLASLISEAKPLQTVFEDRYAVRDNPPRILMPREAYEVETWADVHGNPVLTVAEENYWDGPGDEDVSAEINVYGYSDGKKIPLLWTGNNESSPRNGVSVGSIEDVRNYINEHSSLPAVSMAEFQAAVESDKIIAGWEAQRLMDRTPVEEDEIEL